MKRLLLLVIVLLSSGCSHLTPEQNDQLVRAGTTLLVKVVDAKLASQPVEVSK